MVKDSPARQHHQIVGTYVFDADAGMALFRVYPAEADGLTPRRDEAVDLAGVPLNGWSASCRCGWSLRGDWWAKEDWPDSTNDPPQELKDELRRRWLVHAEPQFRVEDAGRAFEEARTELDLAVIDARRNGITWREIAVLLDITRQSAHKRWAAAADRALGRR